MHLILACPASKRAILNKIPEKLSSDIFPFMYPVKFIPTLPISEDDLLKEVKNIWGFLQNVLYQLSCTAIRVNNFYPLLY